MRSVTRMIVLAIASLLIACGSPEQAEPARAVRIAGAAYLGDLPTHVADARGLFSEHGLSASVQFSDSGKRNLERLRAGEADFALMALTPLVLDRLADPDPGQADDPVILASLLQSYELTAVVAAPDSGIERPEDFRGRRIAFERGTNTEFVWWLFEQFHVLDRPSIEPVSIPFPETAEAFVSGGVDAAVLPEPWASQLEARLQRMGKPAPRRFDTRNLYAGRWVVVTTRGFAEERRDICREVLAAYRQAIDYIEHAPADAIAIYTRRIQNGDSLLAERWEALDYDISLDWALIASLQEQFRWTRNIGIANAGGPVRVLHLLEPAPLRTGWPDSIQIPFVPTAAGVE